MAVSRQRRIASADEDQDPPQGVLETRNEVSLVGRVAAAVEERTLPSGDEIAVFRVVVDRPANRLRPREGVRTTTVDALDCVAWAAGVRRTARRLAAGDIVEIEGALRRRFWRSGAAAVSRCEVEVFALKRLRRAAPVVATVRTGSRRAARPASAGSPTDPTGGAVAAGDAAAGGPGPDPTGG